jgi:hypothetical protein
MLLNKRRLAYLLSQEVLVPLRKGSFGGVALAAQLLGVGEGRL